MRRERDWDLLIWAVCSLLLFGGLAVMAVSGR